MITSPYREQILDHYQNPRFQGQLASPDLQGEVDNPICGDTVRMELRLDAANRIVEAVFDGQGCVLSMAAASMLTEYVQGRTLSDLQKLTEQDMLEMLGVELSRARTQCAILPLQALEMALKDHKPSKVG